MRQPIPLANAGLAGAPRAPHALTTARVPRVAPVRLLVVDDDTLVRQACAEAAASLGYLVETAESVPSARTVLARSPVDVLLLDLRLPGANGMSLLEEMPGLNPHVSTVVMTAFSSVNNAVEAMRTGAGDYLEKPFSLQELTQVLERAAERRSASNESLVLREILRLSKFGPVAAGHDPAIEKLFRILAKVAHTTHPVLIVGEPGTGKESIARAIHSRGPNAARPFIPVDCGSLMPSLVEAELFGRSSGLYPKPGLLAGTPNGTVFLDEVGDLSPELQARLVRALNDRAVRSPDGGGMVPLTVRLLASSNRNLVAMVERGQFRKDLFYKLNVVNMRVPALRERRGDLPLLIAQCLDECAQSNGTQHSFSEEAFQCLLEYEWPGNLRELEHTIERACALSSGEIVTLADLTTQLREYRLQLQASQMVAQHRHDLPSDIQTMEEIERQAILGTLRKLNGDKLRTAKLLGIGKTTLYRKLKEYGFSEEDS